MCLASYLLIRMSGPQKPPSRAGMGMPGTGMGVPPGTGMGMGGMGGGPVQATMRPGTMMSGTPGSSLGPMAGMPPQTGARIPTQSQRLGTGARTRQGTAAQAPVLGVGAHTEINITDRPMTMQGVMGVKTGAIGPKRQIYDKTYYMSELRKRISSLGEEITNLNKEINEIQQENNLYAVLEKRYDSLVKTVRTLEGDLADHNLATDKQRTDTGPEEVHHMYMIMRSQNEQVRNEVDQIFLEKRSHEEEIGRMEQEINSMVRAAEERLNELHPDQRREYEDLQEENKRLSKDLPEGHVELEQIQNHVNAMENRLKSDVNRARFQHLLNVRKELADKHAHLEKEVQQCSLSHPEQRDLLLSRVKSDNAEIVQVEKLNQDLKLENEKLRAQIREVAVDAKERKDEGSDQQKYEILFTKDQEMSTFIDAFPESKAEEEKKMKSKQDSIMILLENIQKSLGLPNDVSAVQHLHEMEDELDFKNKQLQNSETTHHRLEAELKKREGELEKIESLDVKISSELQQVEAKMRQYEKDIEQKYDLIDDMRLQGEEQLKQRKEQRKFLESRLAALKQQVGFLKLRYESKRQQLTDNENGTNQDVQNATNLDTQEQKIRQFGQTLFALRSFITSKSNESNYQNEMESTLEMAGLINKMLQEQTQRAPACA